MALPDTSNNNDVIIVNNRDRRAVKGVTQGCHPVLAARFRVEGGKAVSITHIDGAPRNVTGGVHGKLVVRGGQGNSPPAVKHAVHEEHLGEPLLRHGKEGETGGVDCPRILGLLRGARGLVIGPIRELALLAAILNNGPGGWGLFLSLNGGG